MEVPHQNRAALAVDPAELAQVLADLGLLVGEVASEGIASENTASEETASEDAEALLIGVAAGSGVSSAQDIKQRADRGLSESGALLLFLEGRRDEQELAAWRNELWPLLHMSVIYSITTDGVKRRTLAGSQALGDAQDKAHRVRSGMLLVGRRRVHSMSPDATTVKFDANATSWNGDPSGPGYPHFRWMRRFVGCFAQIPRGASILDFGCGAGWCGIEAAKQFGARSLRFFDPSPEMVRIATENAAAAGLADAEGRTGFGEAPPYPAEGEAPFDAVISSGVVSFSPDLDAWVDGLARSVKRGGVLVVGDINRDSRGMRRRRREKALLPAREMNASTAAEIRTRLEAEGFIHQGGAGYQLTRPFPEAMHVNETRLRGLLTYPLLWSNQLMASANEHIGLPGARQFDSWVMRFTHRA